MRIKSLRHEFEYTQEELGKKIGQTKSNISKYENGVLEPGIDTLKELAKLFDVSLDYLTSNSNIRNPYIETSIMEKYRKDIEALEKFRSLMIDKGYPEYEDKTLEELVDSVIMTSKIEEAIKNKSKKGN